MKSGCRSYAGRSSAFALSWTLSPLVVSLVACLAPAQGITDKATAAQPTAASLRSWPMLGGSPQRNMVNSVEKGIPTQWDIAVAGGNPLPAAPAAPATKKEGAQKNIKWVAQIGTHGYGCAIVIRMCSLVPSATSGSPLTPYRAITVSPPLFV